MAEILTFERVLWGFTVFLKAVLVVLLLYRKNHRAFPFFFVYALLNSLQSAALFESYRIWGFGSATSMRIAWSTQGLVTLARSLAVAEICHRILARFRGIWGLAWRLLAVTAMFVSLYSWGASRGRWEFAILNLDRALELVIASVIVVLFLFARWYGVTVSADVRLLSIGFFLYSCFRILNDTILERWLNRYAPLWNLLDVVAFLLSLLLWKWALRQMQQRTSLEPELLPGNLYRSLSPEINARLKTLNEQLNHFGYAEGKKT